MADTNNDQPDSFRLEFSDKEKKKAQAWFKKAADTRERREYDYAIEAYVTGLGAWPEAVEEGWKPLFSLAVQRSQTGGKKPGMMDRMKLSTTGKDPKQNTLNAATLLAKDPTNHAYADALLAAAAQASYIATCEWITPIVVDSLKKQFTKEKKAAVSRLNKFHEITVDLAGKLEATGDSQAAWFYEQAVTVGEFFLARDPDNHSLRDFQRDISSKLTIVRGKYNDGESFRDSIKDADEQKLLHDAERVKQGENTEQTVISNARQEYEAHPEAAAKVITLADLLSRTEKKPSEDEAIKVLLDAYKRTHNYSFKVKADDIRLRQLQREARDLLEQLKQGANEGAKQQARLVRAELLQTEAEIYRERVAQYPTDLRLKYRLGKSLFQAKDYDEAIPMFQQSQNDPRSRSSSQMHLGRSFFEKSAFGQAKEVLKDALAEHENPGDDLGKEMLYWLSRAYVENNEIEEAKTSFGKLLRMDYNFANGDARTRFEALK